MRQFGPILLLLLALAGCRTPGETQTGTDRTALPLTERSGMPSSRPEVGPETDPLKPRHWLHTPGSGIAGRQPPGGGLVGSKDESGVEVKGLLSGYVVGPEGQKIRKATIQVEPVNSPGEGPIDYESQTDGSFMIAGLTTGKSYRLTVRHNDEGVISAGQVVTKVPNVHVRISLIEGLELTPGKVSPAPKSDLRKPLPKPGEPLPKMVDDPIKPKKDPLKEPPAFLEPFDSPGPLPPPGGASSLHNPQPLIRDTNLTPNRRTDLPADGWSPTQPDLPAPLPRSPDRPDLNTRRPDDFRPPVVDLPPPVFPGAGRQESRRPSADEFYLIDENGKERRFPSGRPGELLLVDFMTTTCVPCQRALPTLTAVQAKYAERGLQVIGVSCDDEDLRTRVVFAGKYRKEHAVNFPILTEPGKQPGTVMKKFGVKVYPTAVLLDSAGSVLWQGNPGDAKALVAAIEGHLSK